MNKENASKLHNESSIIKLFDRIEFQLTEKININLSDKSILTYFEFTRTAFDNGRNLKDIPGK